MRRRGVITSTMAIAVAWCAVPMVGAPAQVHAVATLTTSLYEMNEASGSTVLVDSSGNGVNGTIGQEVQLNASYSGAVGHRYPYLAPNTPPAHPQHLDRAPDNTLHDPGTSDYAVSVRYRTTRSFGNLIQKGQNATNGGYFKIELPAGNVTCLYKDSQGRQMAVTTTRTYNDGAWHVVRCERLAGRINLYMDGVLTNSINRQSGNINNTWGLSIGGKPDCDQVTVSCDYFVGDIDWVRIEKGAAPTNSPPTARFTDTCTGLSCTFNGTTSSDPNGPIASYAWTFGDGGTATGATPPAHVYALGGNYTVGLTVTDGAGLMNTTSRTISVTVPNTPPTAVFTEVCTGLSCVFDGSTSSDLEAPIASYAWTFGDGGTATGANPPAHVYGAANTYTVGLTVTDSNNVSRSTSHTVTVAALPVPPVAAFTYSCIDTACTLDGSTSSDANGPIASYAWVFDGITSGDMVVTHDFLATGPHAVELTVTDGTGGTNTLTDSITIAEPEPPTAAFTYECDLLACSFDATTSADPHGQIVSYDWDFGDLATATGSTTNHDFAGFGDHIVTLTVTDGTGTPDIEQKTITLVEPPVSAITFVGQSSSSVNLTTHTTRVPAAVQAGDGLLLFITTASNATIGTPTGVTGWAQLDSIGNINGTTRVWRKVAGPTDANAQVSIGLSALSKANIMVVAYRGTAAGDPVATFARTLQTNSTASRTTPIATVGTPSWVVSYWSHRDSATTALAPPAGVSVRSTGTQSGGGRVTTLLADNGAVAPAGPYGGLTAVANGGTSSFGTTWTIVLAPA